MYPTNELSARVADFNALMWNSIEGEAVDQELKNIKPGAYIRIIFDHELFYDYYMRGRPSTRAHAPVGIRRFPSVMSYTFRVDLHHLLSVESSQFCINKMFDGVVVNRPSILKRARQKISMFACARAHDAYFAGCDTLRIVSRVEFMRTKVYEDRDAATRAFHDVDVE